MYWDLLESLIRRFEAVASSKQLRPPATSEQIDELEARLGFALPASLVDAWREHDGTCDPDEASSDVGLAPWRLVPELLSIDAMATSRARILEHWGPDLEDVRFLVPIQGEHPAELQYLCVDAKSGAVVAIDFEDSSSDVVAASLLDWFRHRAEEAAADNGFRFDQGRAECIEPELLQVRRLDEGGVQVGPEVVQWPSLASLDEWHEGEPCASLSAPPSSSSDAPALAVGDIVRCEVARVPAIVLGFTIVEPVSVRLQKVDEALAGWREVGFQLPPLTPQDLLALPWEAEAAAACFVARSGPVLKEPWGPPILGDTLAKLNAKLMAWGVPRVAIDRDAVLDEALRAARAEPVAGTLFLQIQRIVFARINAELTRWHDPRSFIPLEGAPPPLDGAWILADASQAHALKRLLRHPG